MPINKRNQLVFHRTLYAGQLQTVTLLKRNDDMQASVVRSLTLYQCRQGIIHKTGQPIQGDMLSDHRCTWYLPRSELDRVGVLYINMLDRIVDKYNRVWQPESPTLIVVKLFEDRVNIDTKRADGFQTDLVPTN